MFARIEHWLSTVSKSSISANYFRNIQPPCLHEINMLPIYSFTVIWDQTLEIIAVNRIPTTLLFFINQLIPWRLKSLQIFAFITSEGTIVQVS